MNFTTFPVDSTNIFPLSNSTKGGQLLTEYNLRSRESICTPESVEYIIGPSYVHSESDFFVECLTDDEGVPVSSSTLQIRPGRGVLNGHYVELLTPMIIDLDDANAYAQTHSEDPLRGKLCIGIRIMYSTNDSMAGESTNSSIGAMLPEDKSGSMYRGVQLVILPPDKFKLPEDVPRSDQESSVTAHIKLAEFSYINGAIQGIVNNYPGKCQSISATRISGVDSLLSDEYVSMANLDPKKLYAFSGRGASVKKSTWCDSTDSLMIWDNSPKLASNKPQYREAQFVRNVLDDTISLYVPHKQVDGGTYDSKGNIEYYQPKLYQLPQADYSSGMSGLVTKEYTNHIKSVASKLSEIYRMPNGKQVGYISTLDYKLDESGDKDLPDINPSWVSGDYVVVGQDNTIGNVVAGRAPSTMYVVLPGKVLKIAPEALTAAVEKQWQVVDSFAKIVANAQSKVTSATDRYNEITTYVKKLQSIVDYITVRDNPPSDTKREMELVVSAANTLVNKLSENSDTATTQQNAKAVKTQADNLNKVVTASTAAATLKDLQDAQDAQADIVSEATKAYNQAYAKLEGARNELKKSVGSLTATQPPSGMELGYSETTTDPATLTIDEINTSFWVLGSKSEYRGVQGKDYFRLSYTDPDDNIVTNYYYVVSDEGDMSYSDPVYLTREIPLAEEAVIGGFLNIEDSYTDAGYVRRDESGHLRLVDYDLLRSGALAYQLGDDLVIPAGITSSEIQNYLDDYVNQRVAYKSNGSKNIDITFTLPTETEKTEITIHDIDSRFNTYVTIHINGASDSNTVLNIADCQKVRIDPNIQGAPQVNLYRSCLYYDDSILNYLSQIEDLNLWYIPIDESDANLLVSGLTVTVADIPSISEDLSYWSKSATNDNHFLFALRSLTFAPNGDIVGCSLYVKNSSTYNVELGDCIVLSDFELPQSAGFSYPLSRMTRKLKITGSFITAYPANGGYIVADSSFSALSQTYNKYATGEKCISGHISIRVQSSNINTILGDKIESIDEWEPTSYHIFEGGAIS